MSTICLSARLRDGDEIQATVDRNVYKFAGYERDPETNHDYVFARYYMPGSGRWLSPDPLGGGYGYGSNSPVSRIDPTGRMDCQATIFRGDECVEPWGGGVGLEDAFLDDWGTSTTQGPGLITHVGAYVPSDWLNMEASHSDMTQSPDIWNNDFQSHLPSEFAGRVGGDSGRGATQIQKSAGCAAFEHSLFGWMDVVKRHTAGPLAAGMAIVGGGVTVFVGVTTATA